MGVILNMTEKEEKSSESTKDEAIKYFAKKLAGVKETDTPYYYLWSEFLGGLAIVSFKFWIMYLTDHEGFKEKLDDDPKVIIDTVLQMWKVKVINEIDKEIEHHKKMVDSPFGKMFGKMMTSTEQAQKEMYETINMVEEKARQVLYDGIITKTEDKTE